MIQPAGCAAGTDVPCRLVLGRSSGGSRGPAAMQRSTAAATQAPHLLPRVPNADGLVHRGRRKHRLLGGAPLQVLNRCLMAPAQTEVKQEGSSEWQEAQGNVLHTPLCCPKCNSIVATTSSIRHSSSMGCKPQQAVRWSLLEGAAHGPLARRRGLPHMYPAAAIARSQAACCHGRPVYRVALCKQAGVAGRDGSLQSSLACCSAARPIRLAAG